MAESLPVTSASPNQPAPSPQAAPAEQAVQTSEVQGRDLMGRFLSKNGSDEPSGTREPQPVSGEILVEDDGVQRRVNVSDLVREAREARKAKADAEALSTAAKAQMVRDASLAQIGQRIDSMSPQQREALLRVLQQPDMLVKPQPSSQAPDDLFGMGDSPPAPNPLESRLADLERLATTSAEVLAQIGRERHEVNISQSIEAAMRQLPIYEQVPGELREAAREAIAMDLARTPQGNLQDIVLHRAQRLAEIHRRYQAAQGLVTTAPAGAGQQARRFTAKDLKTGAILDAAREAARQHGVL